MRNNVSPSRGPVEDDDDDDNDDDDDEYRK